MTAASEMRKSLFDEITAALPGVVVLEYVPTNQPLPYVELGERSSPDFATKDGGDEWHIFTVHYWDNLGGVARVEDWQAAVFARLQGRTPATVDCSAGAWRRDSALAMKDADGVTGHGVDRWRVCTGAL